MRPQGLFRAARVHEAVGDVEGPGGEADNGGKPDGQDSVDGPGESQCPDDGDGGCVEAGEMPESQRSRGVELGTDARRRGGQRGHYFIVSSGAAKKIFRAWHGHAVGVVCSG